MLQRSTLSSKDKDKQQEEEVNWHKWLNYLSPEKESQPEIHAVISLIFNLLAHNISLFMQSLGAPDYVVVYVSQHCLFIIFHPRHKKLAV